MSLGRQFTQVLFCGVLSICIPYFLAFSTKAFAEDEQSISSGTGWFVAPHFVVTNHHVVGESSTVALILTDNRQIIADVVMSDPVNDVAILKPRKTNTLPPGLPMAASSSNVGANVFTIGYPLLNIMGREPKLTTGIINSRTGIANDPRTYQISVPIQPGNSGGPVFNMNGEVIGIATSSLSAAAVFKWAGNIPQNVNYAIKTNYVRALLDATPVQGQSSIPTIGNAPGNLEELVQRVKNSIVIVLAGGAVTEPENGQSSASNTKPEEKAQTTTRGKQSYALFVYMKPHDWDVRNGYTKTGLDDTINNFSGSVSSLVENYLKKVSTGNIQLKEKIVGEKAEHIVYDAFNYNHRDNLCRKSNVDFLFVSRNSPEPRGLMDNTYYIFDCKSKAEFYYTKNLQSNRNDSYLYESHLKKILRTMLEDMPSSVKLEID